MSGEQSTILQPPKGFDTLLELLARETLREQPKDIKAFAAQLLADRLIARCENNTIEGDMITSSKADESLTEALEQANINGAGVAFRIDTTDAASMVQDQAEEEDMCMKYMELPPQRRGRRVSVSAESMNPNAVFNPADRVVHPKTEEQSERILTMVKNNFLFGNLDSEQLEEVILSMFEKQVTMDTNIITQGDNGDYFYVVESGTFDIFVNDDKVGSTGSGGSFGELALMYNAPRAATIKCTSESSVLWAMDRVTFRRILMNTTSKKRKMYEKFLSTIEILSCIEPYERCKIADGLDPETFEDGDDVITQGELGTKFYLIEKGEAIAIVDGMEVAKLKQGDYFGELALLFSQPRKATVRAVGGLTVATLGVEAFDRMLGPCSEIMRRGVKEYEAKVQEAKMKSTA